MIIRLKGIKRTTVKGHTYYYHRATGKRIKATAGSAAFAEEVARLDRQATEAAQAPHSAANTWTWLVELYRGSPEWEALAPRTRRDYQQVFDYLHEPEPGKPGMDAVPLADITGPRLIALRDKTFRKRGRSLANYVVAVVSLVFNWGRPRGKCGANPADGLPKIRRPRDARVVNRPWADSELTAVLAAAPPQMKIAIALGAYTGIREGDVLKLPWSAYDDEVVIYKHGKTGEPIWIPAHRDLRTVLTAERQRLTEVAEPPAPHFTIVTNSRGQPFTESGFRASFFKLLRDLQQKGKIAPGLTFHGLRHTVATRLADAGADERTIMAMTGHTTAAMVQRYTKSADKRRRATEAVRLLEGDESDRNTE